MAQPALAELGSAALAALDDVADQISGPVADEWIEEAKCLADIVDTILLVTSEAPHAKDLPSARQTSEVFDLLIALLESDDAPARLSYLLFQDTSSPVFAALTKFAHAATTTAMELRTHALMTLCRTLRLLVPSEPRLTQCRDAMLRLATRTAQALLKAESITTLLTVMVSDGRAEARAAAAEALSLMVMLGEAGQLAFLVSKGLPLALQQLADDIAPDVRRHCAAIVHNCGARFPSDVLAENGLPVLLGAVSLDASAEVRTLCANALAVLFGAEPAALRTAAAQYALVDTLRRRIAGETATRALEAVLRLLEASLLVDASVVAAPFVATGGIQALLDRTLATQPIAALATHVLRVMVERAPPSARVPRKIVLHFPWLSVLLKNASAEIAREDVFALEARVELSLALGLMCALDPLCRDRLRRELAPYPTYLGTLKKTLLEALTMTAPETFLGMWLRDCLDRVLNSAPRTAGTADRVARAVLRAQSNAAAALEVGATAAEVATYGTDVPPELADEEDRVFAGHLAAELIFGALDSALTVVRGTTPTAAAAPASAPVSNPFADAGRRAASPGAAGGSTPRHPAATPSRASGGTPSRASAATPGPGAAASTPTAAVATPTPTPAPLLGLGDLPVNRTPEWARLQAAGYLAPTRHDFLRKGTGAPRSPLPQSRSPPRSPPPSARHQQQQQQQQSSPQPSPTYMSWRLAMYGDRLPSGFVRRQVSPRRLAGASPRSQRRDVKKKVIPQGCPEDVFGFSLPLEDINAVTLRELRQYMQRHALHAKKYLLILPQQHKARRLFLAAAQELGKQNLAAMDAFETLIERFGLSAVRDSLRATFRGPALSHDNFPAAVKELSDRMHNRPPPPPAADSNHRSDAADGAASTASAPVAAGAPPPVPRLQLAGAAAGATGPDPASAAVPVAPSPPAASSVSLDGAVVELLDALGAMLPHEWGTAPAAGSAAAAAPAEGAKAPGDPVVGPAPGDGPVQLTLLVAARDAPQPVQVALAVQRS